MMFGTTISEDDSFEILDAFVEAGGTWIDTADCYSFWADDSGRGGQSERLLGRWLAARPGVRERVRISTKTGCEPLEPGSFPERVEGLSAKSMRHAMARSLDRLGTDRVDMFWAHMEDRSVPFEESATTLGELAAEGLTSEVGLSNHPAYLAERAMSIAGARDLPTISALQLSYSYVRRRPGAPVEGVIHPNAFATEETLDFVRTTPGMTLWAYTPLMSGRYDYDDRPMPESHTHPGTERRMEALAKVAAELGVPKGQVVLAWLVGGNTPILPILGGSKLYQLESAVAGVRLELSEEQRKALDSAW
jgi:aryl-alcohol dehydrogenase-like predicted oxidoreductase